MLPPETFQGDLGLRFAPPPAWSPSERLVPFPSTGPDPDSIPPPMSQFIEVFSPEFQGSPIFPHPDLPPPKPRVPSPESETFANSPKSPPSVIPSPENHEISSPGKDDQSNFRGTGQIGSSFRPIKPSPESSPSVKSLPPREAPFGTPRIWGTPPAQQKVWKNDPNHPWGKPKKSHESTKHRKSKKKHKFRKHHHTQKKHKGL